MHNRAVATPQSSVDLAEAEVTRGSTFLRDGQIPEAVRAYQAALAASPGDARILAMLGLAYFRGGLFAEARPVYEELVALAPGDASHHLNLGLVYLKVGDADGAIRELEASRNADPSQSRAASYLGLAYARGGRYVEAYQAFLQAGQLDLAREVEEHLTPDDIAAVEASLARKPASALPPVAGNPAEPAPIATPVDDDLSASQQFVALGAAGVAGDASDVDDSARPTQPARPSPLDPASSISRAVAQASPASPVGGSGTRVAAGNRPPMSLTEFATARLVRPEDGDHPFEIGSGGVLIVRVGGRVFSRTEGVDVTGGQLAYEAVTRRSRGAQTQEPWGDDGRPMFAVSGQGFLVAVPMGGTFTAVQLDDDILYLREDLVFAFEAEVRWENGHVPGSRSRLRMVQFRGHGAVAFKARRPLLAVKLSAPGVLYVDAAAIAGWIGRVVPRAVAPASGSQSSLFVECSGEGVVLVEEETGAADDDAAAAPAAAD